MEKAIEIGESLGVMRNESSCDYSYLIRVRNALQENGTVGDMAYVQKLIDALEQD